MCRQSEVAHSAYYEYHTDECLNNRYYIKSSIGKVCFQLSSYLQGSFSEVVLAWDKVSEKQVAIKIIRSGDLFLEQVELLYNCYIQSQIEIQLYELLQKSVDPDRQYIVQLLDISS